MALTVKIETIIAFERFLFDLGLSPISRMRVITVMAKVLKLLGVRGTR